VYVIAIITQKRRGFKNGLWTRTDRVQWIKKGVAGDEDPDKQDMERKSVLNAS